MADQADSTVPPSGRSTTSCSRPSASRYRAKRRTRTRTLDARLEAVRLAAAAARLHVRILDREAGAHHAVVDEVDLAAAQVREAVLVDVDLDALSVDHVVARRGLVFPAELVRHPGAATAHHADPETPLGLAFLEAELRHLLRSRFSHRHHARSSRSGER